MANEMFYVKIETSRDITVYGFSRSATGILDFVDGASAKDEELSQMQCVDGSAYFTPSWYMFLPKDLQATINVYLPSDVKNLDVGQYSFLLHIGALLLAVDERDGLLVAELLRRRVTVFSSFLPLVLHLIKPVAAEALFAYVYGGFCGDSNFSQIYKANVPIATGETDVSAILLEAAKVFSSRIPKRNLLKKCSSAISAKRNRLTLRSGLWAQRTTPGLLVSKSMNPL